MEYADPSNPLADTCYRLGLLFKFKLLLQYLFKRLSENYPSNIVSGFVWRHTGLFAPLGFFIGEGSQRLTEARNSFDEACQCLHQNFLAVRAEFHYQ